MSTVIRWVSGSDLWLESYDVDAVAPEPRSYVEDDGRVVLYGAFGGVIKLTPRQEEALRFEDAAAALLAWNTVSRRRPLRPDGRPSKPLTALTVEIATVEPCG